MTYAIAEYARIRETSVEIALAIFEIAAEGDEDRMWREPTDDEIRRVETRAWELTDASTDTLFWGITTLTRHETNEG